MSRPHFIVDILVFRSYVNTVFTSFAIFSQAYDTTAGVYNYIFLQCDNIFRFIVVKINKNPSLLDDLLLIFTFEYSLD